MGLNILERTFLKLAWKRLEAKVPAIKRWLPLIGGIGLIVSFGLDAFGYTEFGNTLRSLLKLTGAEDASPVGSGDVSAFATAVASALALGSGIFLKLKSVASK